MTPLPLALRPLDKLQILDRRTIAESMLLNRAHPAHRANPPFWFFQRRCEDGLLEVATASGYLARVSLADVCDVVACAEPVVVMAMTPSAFALRSRLPLRERQQQPSAGCYAPAQVARVERDRWGHHTFLVVFLDPAHNGTKGLHRAALLDGEASRVQKLLVRTRMPVVCARNRTHSYGGEDRGRSKQTLFASAQSRAFLGAALSGNAKEVARLGAIDASVPKAARRVRRPRQQTPSAMGLVQTVGL